MLEVLQVYVFTTYNIAQMSVRKPCAGIRLRDVSSQRRPRWYISFNQSSFRTTDTSAILAVSIFKTRTNTTQLVYFIAMCPTKSLSAALGTKVSLYCFVYIFIDFRTLLVHTMKQSTSERACNFNVHQEI
jgi:hypothetical protein